MEGEGSREGAKARRLVVEGCGDRVCPGRVAAQQGMDVHEVTRRARRAYTKGAVGWFVAERSGRRDSRRHLGVGPVGFTTKVAEGAEGRCASGIVVWSFVCGESAGSL